MVINTIAEAIMSLFGIDAKTLSNEFGIASDGFAGLEEDLLGIETASNNAKKSLRGFDKLNNITTPTSSKSSLGNGVGTIDQKFLDALNEYNLHLDKMKNKATEIRDKILNILGLHKELNLETLEWEWKYDGFKTTIKNLIEWFKELNPKTKYFVGLFSILAIGKVFNGFKTLVGLIPKSSTSIGKLVNNLKLIKKWDAKNLINGWSESLTMAEKFNSVLIGSTGIVAGMSLVKDGFSKIRETGMNTFSALEVAGGTTASIISGAFLGGSIGGVGGGILGAIVGGLLAIGASFDDSSAKIKDGVVDIIPSLEEYQTAIDNAKTSAEKQTQELDNQIGLAKNLTDMLGNLIDENGKVDESNERVTEITKLLNEQLGIELEITDGQIYLDGQLIDTKQKLKEKVDKYCESLRIEGYLEAYREHYVKLIQEQGKAQEEYNTVMKDLIESQKDYDLTTRDGYTNWVKDNQDKILKLKTLDEVIGTNEAKLSNYEKASYEASQGNYDKAYELLTTHTDDVKTSYEDVINDILDKNNTLEKDVKNKSKIIASENTIWTIDVDVNDKNFVIFQQKLSRGGNFAFGLGGTMGARADGGFIKSGEIVTVNENNTLEYVGKFGNQHAVANTDQIVDGIAIGVTKAMLATGGQDKKVVIEAKGDTSGLLDFITFEQKKKDRQYGL